MAEKTAPQNRSGSDVTLNPPSTEVPSSKEKEAKEDLEEQLRQQPNEGEEPVDCDGDPEGEVIGEHGQGADVLAKDDAELEFPGDDGSIRAWLVVAGAAHLTFSTFGFTNSWAVFQNYYSTHELETSTASAIAWIGSLQYCLIFLPALVTGRMLDLGHFRLPFSIAGVLYIVSVFLTSLCKEYYQFILCQGLLLGLSSGFLFGPALSVVGHWFKKKRAFAYGWCAIGSSVGGTVFPLIVKTLLPKVGFPWTMRICGFIVLYSVGFAGLVMKPRLKPANMPGGLFNIVAFKSPPFALYVLSCTICIMGLYTPLTYITDSGISIGLPTDYSFDLIAIANAASSLGRLGPGIFADKIGVMNLMIPFMLISGCLMFAWPYAQTKGSLTAFGVLYGISSGAFVSLFSPGVAQLGNSHDIGRRMGMLTTCLAFAALVGPPISGAILGSTNDSYLHVAGFSGSVVLLGTLLMFASRWTVVGVWGKI